MSKLSIIVSFDPYLDPAHLAEQARAFNKQTHPAFQVYYLNQAPHKQTVSFPFETAFEYKVIPIPYPEIEGVICWDLVAPLGELLPHLETPYFTYLHQECIPHSHFVQDLLEGIQEAKTRYDTENIYRLNQLRMPHTLQDIQKGLPLKPEEGVYWSSRKPYNKNAPKTKPTRWQEDAFALSTRWAEKNKIFSCVTWPLFFQDLFDVFFQLEDRPYLNTQVITLGKPIIFHLQHPRAFMEYRAPFLKAVRQNPKLFGHLALYELADSDFHYTEDFKDKTRNIPQFLHQFVHYMRYSEQGTVSQWIRALDQAHTR